LHRRHRDDARQRHCIARAGREREPKDVRIECVARAIEARWGQFRERDGNRRRRRGDQRFKQRFATVVDRLESIPALGEVDGHEARRFAAGHGSKQRALMLQRAAQVLRDLPPLRVLLRTERVGQDVCGARRVALMQRSLRNHQRPIRVPFFDLADDPQQRALLEVESLDHGKQQVRATPPKGDVLAWIVGRLAEPARVEEADDRRLARKIEDARRSRARRKTTADCGVARSGQCANDRGLAALHLAEHPHDRRKLARALGDGRVRISRSTHRLSSLVSAV